MALMRSPVRYTRHGSSVQGACRAGHEIITGICMVANTPDRTTRANGQHCGDGFYEDFMDGMVGNTLDRTTQATGQHCWDGLYEGFLDWHGKQDTITGACRGGCTPHGSIHTWMLMISRARGTYMDADD